MSSHKPLGARSDLQSGDLDSIPSDTPIYVGPGSLAFIDGGYPNNKTSPWPAKWLEEHNLVELPPTASSAARGEKGSDRRWEAMGCFEHAMDWFGDGSFWVMDTGGVSRTRGATRGLLM